MLHNNFPLYYPCWLLFNRSPIAPKYNLSSSYLDSGNIANDGYSLFAFDGVSIDSGGNYGIAFQVKGSGKVMCGISHT